VLPSHRSVTLDQVHRGGSDPTPARARRSAWAAGTALTVRLPTDQASQARAETGTIAPRSDVRSLFPILWQIGYTVNDNASVWANEPDERYKKEQ
jgi:hypothetical protein